MLFSAFPVTLQVDTFLTMLVEATFLGLLGVGLMVIMVAPFVGWFRHSEENVDLQRKRTRSFKKDAVADIEEKGLGRLNDSVFPSDFVYEDAS